MKTGEAMKTAVAAMMLLLASTAYPTLAAESQPVAAAATEENFTPPSLWMEELTWPEIALSLRGGYRTVIVPTAGIEQNGPHVPLYKHRLVVRVTAEKIADTLRNTLVAPVIDFVPEGDIAKREGHMAYPGTISMPPRVFSSILENTALSLFAHGFTTVLFVGDSGDSQEWQARVAKTMRSSGYAVYHIESYYANAAQEALLRQRGYSDAQIGGHAGLRDTSEFMAVRGRDIRKERLEFVAAERMLEMGTYGDLTQANSALGTELLQMKADRAVNEICGLGVVFPGCPH